VRASVLLPGCCSRRILSFPVPKVKVRRPAVAGVSLCAAVLWGLALLVAFAAARRWVSVPAASILVFLAAMASSERFLPRPEVVTCLMNGVFWLLLQSGARTVKGALAIIVAQVVP
jgi:hypothetical protein